ncbi:response regulator transcription factor [Actinomycetaceae bacterium L2_0104]
MIRVAAADDDPVVLKYIAWALEETPDIHVVSEASNGQELLQLLEENVVDVALVDIDMPVLDGIAVTEQIKRFFPNVTVIILTAFEKEDTLGRALAAGAAGFLTKDTPLDVLPALVKEAYAGGTVLGTRPASILVDTYRNQAIRRQEDSEFVEAVESLPTVIRRVFSLVVVALPNKVIAKELGLTASTVRTYVTRILDATKCESRTQLAVRAIAAGLE